MVQFNEEIAQMPVIRPRSLNDFLLDLGIAVSPGHARIILVLLAMVMVALSIYFISSAVPEPPVLGDDIPRKGEVIPKNRSL